MKKTGKSYSVTLIPSCKAIFINKRLAVIVYIYNKFIYIIL